MEPALSKQVPVLFPEKIMRLAPSSIAKPMLLAVERKPMFPESLSMLP